LGLLSLMVVGFAVAEGEARYFPAVRQPQFTVEPAIVCVEECPDCAA
jgi:hypothetical protein